LQLCYPADDPLVERVVAVEGVVDALAGPEILQQLLVELLDGVGHRGTETLNRSFHASALAGPGLAFTISGTDEKDIFVGRVTRQQEADRAGLGETSEILEVALLTVAILRIVRAHRLGCGGKDGGPAVADGVHEAAAPPGKDLSVEGHEGALGGAAGVAH